jgi:hypothetical protein
MKKREKLAIIQQHYPHAVTTIDSVNRLIDFIELLLKPTRFLKPCGFLATTFEACPHTPLEFSYKS